MMRKLITSLLALAAVSAAPPPAPAPAPVSTILSYRFEDVRRNVKLTSSGHDVNVIKGQLASSGDGVHTGWFSYALIASEQHKARFEIFGSTDVELASTTPGVILSLNHGRMHAIFDKITGTEPRVVQTPGALLAVRGTEYTVSVNGKGETSLDVFEGLVEIRSSLRREPLFVRPGQSGIFGRQTPPSVINTPPERRRDPQHAPFGPDDRDGRGGAGSPKGDNGGHDRPGQPPQQPQQPQGPGGQPSGGMQPPNGPPPPPPPPPHH